MVASIPQDNPDRPGWRGVVYFGGLGDRARNLWGSLCRLFWQTHPLRSECNCNQTETTPWCSSPMNLFSCSNSPLRSRGRPRPRSCGRPVLPDQLRGRGRERGGPFFGALLALLLFATAVAQANALELKNAVIV